MKKNINVNKEQLEKILKNREFEKKTENKENLSNQNQQVETLSKNVFIKSHSKKNEIKVKLSGYIFNVYKDNKNNFTRFIASIDSIKNHIEYHIIGTDNNIGSKAGFQETIIESDEINPKDYVFLDGKKYLIYDPENKNKNIEEEQKNKIKNIDNWIKSLSFYDHNSFFKSISRRKLKNSEIEELISVIKIAKDIPNEIKFLYVSYIRRQKNIRLNVLSDLDDIIYKENPNLTRK